MQNALPPVIAPAEPFHAKDPQIDKLRPRGNLLLAMEEVGK